MSYTTNTTTGTVTSSDIFNFYTDNTITTTGSIPDYCITSRNSCPSPNSITIKDNATAYYYKADQKKNSITIKTTDNNEFLAIKEHVPNKVYTFTFVDKTKIKTICSNEDVFDLEYAFYLALSKKLFSKELTFEGILRMVEEIRCQKYYVNLVKKGIKLFNKMQEEERKKKEQEEIKARRHKKYIEKKKKQKERRLIRQAEILAKALNNKGEE